MLSMDAGIMGAIIGGTIGIAGGIIGTVASIRNTDSEREHALMVRAAVIAWLAVGVFLAGLLMLPTPERFLLWIPYAILVPIGIIRLNRAQNAIRSKEARNDDEAT